MSAHTIPLGTLVEVIPGDAGDGNENEWGIRLRVVRHTRDVDGTPLYALGIKGFESRAPWSDEIITGGFSVESLRVIA